MLINHGDMGWHSVQIFEHLERIIHKKLKRDPPTSLPVTCYPFFKLCFWGKHFSTQWFRAHGLTLALEHHRFTQQGSLYVHVGRNRAQKARHFEKSDCGLGEDTQQLRKHWGCETCSHWRQDRLWGDGCICVLVCVSSKASEAHISKLSRFKALELKVQLWRDPQNYQQCFYFTNHLCT